MPSRVDIDSSPKKCIESSQAAGLQLATGATNSGRVPPKGPRSFSLNEKVDKVVPTAPRAFLCKTTPVPVPVVSASELKEAPKATPKGPRKSSVIPDAAEPKALKTLEIDTTPKAPKALLAVNSSRKQRVVERAYVEMQEHPFMLPLTAHRQSLHRNLKKNEGEEEEEDDKVFNSKDPNVKNRVDKLSMAVFFPDRDTSNQEQPFSLTQDTKTLSSCASSRITTPTPILLERDRELVSTATVSVPQPESDSSYRITTSTASELVSTITVPAPQPELGFRFQSSEGSWSSSGSSSSSSDCALNDTFGHVVACRSHYESNEQIIQVQRNNGFKPSGIEPVVDVSGATIQTQVSRLPSVSDMPNESNEPSKITSLTNEFWDLQTKLSGMEERLAELLGELRCDTETSDSWDESYSDGRSDIQQPRIFPSSASASNSPISDSFSESSRTSDLHFDLHSACASLDFIRLERKRMEWILEDVKRECRKPMIVPALLELITIKTRRGGDSQV